MSQKPTVPDPTASTPASNTRLLSEAPFRFDEYWLGRGKEFADNTLLGLNMRLQSFITFLNILAGASFLGEIVYTTFLKSANSIVFCFFILPVIMSLVARFEIGIEVVRPTYKSPDLRSPIQINRAFNEIVDSKREQLRLAQPWVLAALATFVICIPIGLFYHNVLTAQELERQKNKKEVILDLLETGFEVSGMVRSPSLEFIVAGTKNLKEKEGQEKKQTKDTLIRFSRDVKKDELFEYYYKYKDFGFELKSIAVKYRDGDVNKTIEKELGLPMDGQELKK